MNDETKARGTVLKGLALATGLSLIGMAAAAGQDHSEGAGAFLELANKQVAVRFDAASGAVAWVIRQAGEAEQIQPLCKQDTIK